MVSGSKLSNICKTFRSTVIRVETLLGWIVSTVKTLISVNQFGIGVQDWQGLEVELQVHLTSGGLKGVFSHSH